VNHKPYARQRRKPPKGSRCDAHVGVDAASHQPRVRGCPNEATVELKGGLFPWETWVCEEHAKWLEENAPGAPPS
jgi:hypothetical protein